VLLFRARHKLAAELEAARPPLGAERKRSKSMKSWLAKWRISAALDAGEPLSESLRQKIAADPELGTLRQTNASSSAGPCGMCRRPRRRFTIPSCAPFGRGPAGANPARAGALVAASGAVAALAVVCLYLGFIARRANGSRWTGRSWFWK
jgi:hypothetical protein